VPTIDGVAVNLQPGPYLRLAVDGSLQLILGGVAGFRLDSLSRWKPRPGSHSVSIAVTADPAGSRGGGVSLLLSADGAMLLTSHGIAASSAGRRSQRTQHRWGAPPAGVEHHQEAVPSSKGTVTSAGPYARVQVDGILQLSLAGGNGFLLDGDFTLSVSPAGLAVSATADLKVVIAAQELLSVSALGGLLIGPQGIAARISLSASAVAGSLFSFSGVFEFMLNTGLQPVPTINNVNVALPAGPYAYLAVGGAMQLAGVLSVSGVFSVSASPQGLEVFADGELSFGPSGSFFEMHALGVLLIGPAGVAGDLDLSVAILEDSVLDGLFSLSASARLIFNTTSTAQSVRIPAAFLPLLSATARARLVSAGDGSGLMLYTVAAGAPLLDGTNAPAGPYLVATLAGQLTIAGFWQRRVRRLCRPRDSCTRRVRARADSFRHQGADVPAQRAGWYFPWRRRLRRRG
jgi:hypothetical protein